MKIAAVILAAGSGSRFGSDKTQICLRGVPLWRHSFDAFAKHPEVDSVGIVCSANNYSAIQSSCHEAEFIVVGGQTRQESSRIAVLNTPSDADIVLIHDAARPLVSAQLISRVIEGVTKHQAAAPGLPVTDTIKRVDERGMATIDRDRLFTVQTPQGALRHILVKAHEQASPGMTDELSTLESIGVVPCLVPGDERNIKVTHPTDMERVRFLLGPPEVRTGIGYDIHRFSDDPARPLMLGGVYFPGCRALEGHSDADVLIHAIVDALLGAAGLGDIGVHFPCADERWKNEPSITFLNYVERILRENRWNIQNVDATLIAESPKIMKRSDEMRSVLAGALEISPSRLNIKATTNESLGAIGRNEGIAAFATAAIAEVIQE